MSEHKTKISYGFAEHQGKRAEMEDIHIVKLIQKWMIFCICDGHGGRGTVDHVKSTVVSRLLEPLVKVCDNESKIASIIKKKIQGLVVSYDRFLQKTVADTSGCTLHIVLFNTEKQRLIQINLGDSRSAMLCNQTKIFQSVDHKPLLQTEQKRIALAHGCVQNGRVNGILAVARALGDFSLKTYRNKPYDPVRGCVSAVPDVFVYDISGCDKSLDFVVACDGIWDVLTAQDVFQIGLSSTSAQEAAQRCLETAFQRQSSDNMSIFYIAISK
jgi:serine/threonine protein phosphatase PrpC